MQNSSCVNKNSTIASCCCNQTAKSKEVQVIKPECLVFNIKAAQQVCFPNSLKNQRPNTVSNGKVKNYLMPVQEYQKLSVNKQKHQEQCKRPNTVQPGIKFCSISCNEYMKQINGKQKQENCCQKMKNQTKTPKQEPIKPKNAEEEKFWREMEEDRWKTTYQTTFTWKTLRNDKLKK